MALDVRHVAISWVMLNLRCRCVSSECLNGHGARCSEKNSFGHEIGKCHHGEDI